MHVRCRRMREIFCLYMIDHDCTCRWSALKMIASTSYIGSGPERWWTLPESWGGDTSLPPLLSARWHLNKFLGCQSAPLHADLISNPNDLKDELAQEVLVLFLSLCSSASFVVSLHDLQCIDKGCKTQPFWVRMYPAWSFGSVEMCWQRTTLVDKVKPTKTAHRHSQTMSRELSTYNRASWGSMFWHLLAKDFTTLLSSRGVLNIEALVQKIGVLHFFPSICKGFRV